MSTAACEEGELKKKAQLPDVTVIQTPPNQEHANPTDNHNHHDSDTMTNSDQSTHAIPHSAPGQSLSAAAAAEGATQNQSAENQIYSHLNQSSMPNNPNEPVDGSSDLLNAYNYYYDPSCYLTSPTDLLQSYQQSLLQQYQQQQLQQSYYSYPSQYETYYDTLQQQMQLQQQQQLSYPFSSSIASNSPQFDSFTNLDQSQQSQVQSYYPFSSGTSTFQSQSFSNNDFSSPFFYDEVPLSEEIIQGSQLAQHHMIPDYQYGTQSREVLGTSFDDKVLHPLSIRRCFNCGDSSHSLAGCPEPRNEPLIRLNKQMFQAQSNNPNDDEEEEDLNAQNDGRSKFKESLVNDNFKDLIDRRKLLASMFSPGQVSTELREALFWEKTRGEPDESCLDPSRPMPWFQAMEKWGYPPSYAIDPLSTRDPFQAVYQRINELERDKAWDSVEILEMHDERLSENDEDDDEEEEDEKILRMLVPGYEARGRQPIPFPPENSASRENSTFPDPKSLPPLPDTPPKDVPLKKLVQYKGGNFSSDRLPVFNGQLISTRSDLDQYTSTAQYYHHHSNRKSDNPHHRHHSPNSPRTSLRRSPPSSKPRGSPYSTSQNQRTNQSNHSTSFKNSKGKKDDEAAAAKTLQKRWKDAALTFAATQQKAQNTPTIAQKSNGSGSGRNKFYIDPDAPSSHKERSIVANEELNYGDDFNRNDRFDYDQEEHRNRVGGRRRHDNHEEFPSRKRRGGRLNGGEGNLSRQRNHNHRAQVYHTEYRNGVASHPNAHRRQDEESPEWARRRGIDEPRVVDNHSKNGQAYKRKITDAYQEEEGPDDRRERDNNHEGEGRLADDGSLLKRFGTSCAFQGGDHHPLVDQNHPLQRHLDTRLPPPLPPAPPPDDPDPPPDL